MKRTLILNEEDLVMVVKEDVVRQVDENRGEMNRSEFVNFLIQSQLKECFNRQDYVTKEAFQNFTQEIMELLQNFLQFFVSYGMALGRTPHREELESLDRQLKSLDRPDEENYEL